ncbi:MAG: hypothetical protein QT09_C0011G0032 [archaeon GW2011_AR18]|nr:MAG: hypothetical protein QT09_C0011G0032 [archaeon GW2011_AR18]
MLGRLSRLELVVVCVFFTETLELDPLRETPESETLDFKLVSCTVCITETATKTTKITAIKIFLFILFPPLYLTSTNHTW